MVDCALYAESNGEKFLFPSTIFVGIKQRFGRKTGNTNIGVPVGVVNRETGMCHSPARWELFESIFLVWLKIRMPNMKSL